MGRRKTLQTNFSAGELAPDLGMRQDTEQYQAGAKSLLNRRCLVGGGTRRRPGSPILAELTQQGRVLDWIVNQATLYLAVFSAGRADFFLTDGTPAGSLTGCPWTGTIWQQMDYVQAANTMFLTHPTMAVQRIVRVGAATWSRTAFTFHTSGASLQQPYFKLADASVTLSPSATTGAITLTLSSAYFVYDHVGARFRYLGREMTITAVNPDFLRATATVNQTLPITQQLTVTSSGDFSIADVVEGKTSGAKGEVVAIPDGTHINVVVLSSSTTTTTTFSTTGAGTRRGGGESGVGSTTELSTAFTVESLTGPVGSTAISAVATIACAAVSDWDEQLFSAVNGYPACVEIHRNRLLFGGHPAIASALIGSVINNFYDFSLGLQNDSDAIFALIGDAAAQAIVQLHSAEQLLILTDHGPYVIPESAQSPLRPTSIAFYPFGSPWPVTATAKARAFDNGLVFCSGSLVIKAHATGNLVMNWDADEISLLSSHIVKTPTTLAVASNFAGGPERYAFFVNTDGTLAVMQLVESQKIRNVTPWETTGTYDSVACIRGDAWVTTTRQIDGASRYFLEHFDQAVTLDAARTFTDLSLIPASYGGEPVNVVTGNQHLGTYPLAITTVPAGPYTVGFYYDSVIETLPPIISGPEGDKAGELLRITRAWIQVTGSARFAANGYTLSAYQIGEDVTAAPPLRDGPQIFEFLGWAREPTITINQPDPLPLEILSIKSEVAF